MVQLSARKFLALCVFISGFIICFGLRRPVPPGFIAAEVFLTILGLFVFGSFKYRLSKNALTYGSILVIGSSFWTGWRPPSSSFSSLPFLVRHFLTLRGLDELVHADTMLFILGLTFFVSVIAQTRLLESISFSVLRKNKGAVLPTIAVMTALVAAASGVLDGVSMIGLLIRTMAIILLLAKAKKEDIIFAVMMSTVVTTVGGMWLAYGEPPNLIMKENLRPFLTNGFFLRYCLPAAVGSYLIALWNLRKVLGGRFVDAVPEELPGDREQRNRSQKIAGLSFVPFVGLLIWHAFDHAVPLFLASFGGFAVALLGIVSAPALRAAAFREAAQEYKEYLFLFPLFLSITLLQKSGFFEGLADSLRHGVEAFGISLVAFLQFIGAALLSALLDNNVVADFASRALRGLDMAVMHLFSMAQIAGYAAGGCWTHIGSAQSVVAYAFILKEVDPRTTPFQWVKAMTPVIIEIFVLMAVVITAESALLKYLH